MQAGATAIGMFGSLFYALLFHYTDVVTTFCGGTNPVNWFPSFSSVIGNRFPELLIWRVGMLMLLPFRFWEVVLYHWLFTKKQHHYQKAVIPKYLGFTAAQREEEDEYQNQSLLPNNTQQTRQNTAVSDIELNTLENNIDHLQVNPLMLKNTSSGNFNQSNNNNNHNNNNNNSSGSTSHPHLTNRNSPAPGSHSIQLPRDSSNHRISPQQQQQQYQYQPPTVVLKKDINYSIQDVSCAQWLISSFHSITLAFEYVGLVALTFVSSKEQFIIHEIGFVLYLVCSHVHILTNFYLTHHTWSLYGKVNMFQWAKLGLYLINLFMLYCLYYFYTRHNAFCEDGIYSWFGLSEYTLVTTNSLNHIIKSLQYTWEGRLSFALQVPTLALADQDHHVVQKNRELFHNKYYNTEGYFLDNYVNQHADEMLAVARGEDRYPRKYQHNNNNKNNNNNMNNRYGYGHDTDESDTDSDGLGHHYHSQHNIINSSSSSFALQASEEHGKIKSPSYHDNLDIL